MQFQQNIYNVICHLKELMFFEILYHFQKYFEIKIKLHSLIYISHG